MQGLLSVVAVLVVIGLIAQHFWVIMGIALVATIIYLAVKKFGPKSAVAEDHPHRMPALPSANLTRRATQWPASQAVYTALDLETTGLDAYSDRIVEIGLVKFTADGTIIDEFSTLVNNPGSSPAASSINGIVDADLVHAPTTEQALREAFSFMAGTVIVAHNWEFEEGFLLAAAQRAELALPSAVAVCTLNTAKRQLDGRGYSLKIMYKTATGTFLNNAHTALADARAVREVVLWLMRTSPTPLYLTAEPPDPEPFTGGNCPISCRPAPMERTSMAALIDAFPQSPNAREGDAEEIERYLALLAESVEDGRLTHEETQALTQQAQLTRLTGTQLRELHRQAWQTLFPSAADWSALDPVSRREAYLLADSLGLTELADDILQAIEAMAEPEPDPTARYLRSLRIGVVGDTMALIELRERAQCYGAKIAVNITKTVQWMATATPDATDPRHNSARKLGIPMLTPEQGQSRLAEAIREAELKAFERQREIDEMEARRRSYRDEQEAYWRPVWRPYELDHAPEREYRY